MSQHPSAPRDGHGAPVRTPHPAGDTADAGHTRATPLRLLDDLDAIVWEFDPAVRRFTYVSAGAERILGYPVERLLEEPGFWRAHIAPEDRERVVATFEAALGRGTDRDIEYRMIAADGARVWLRDMMRVVRDTDGAVAELHGVMVNVTRQKQLEADLRASEERFARFAEASVDGLILHEAGTVLDVNTTAAAMFGYPASEMIGRQATTFTALEDRARLAAHIAADAESPLEGTALRKDGSTFPAEVRGRRITIGGRPARLVIVRDLTESRRAQEALRDIEAQLRQSQKLEAVGRLAGAIAHDFNNLLTVITAFSEMVLGQLAPTDPRHADLDEVVHATRQAAELTRQLLAFGRKQVMRPERLDLAAVVRDVEKMLRRVIGEDVQLETQLAQPGPIHADRSQLEQVLMNLVINARDAMPDGGTVVVTVEQVHMDAAAARRQFGRVDAAGDYVRMNVADTGMGMDESVAARVFEPFFTTKPPGAGSGLGLATVYGIVTQSGGHVVVRSRPGAGTTFSVYFPRVAAPATESEPAPASRVPGGSETILLAEDEESVRLVTQRILQAQGYRVYTAKDGQEAVELADRVPDAALLLTDVVMPRMSGHEAATRIRTAHPHIRVLFMSGYPGDPILRRAIEELGPVLIQKPFSIDTLTRRVRAALDEAPPQ